MTFRKYTGTCIYVCIILYFSLRQKLCLFYEIMSLTRKDWEQNVAGTRKLGLYMITSPVALNGTYSYKCTPMLNMFTTFNIVSVFPTLVIHKAISISLSDILSSWWFVALYWHIRSHSCSWPHPGSSTWSKYTSVCFLSPEWCRRLYLFVFQWKSWNLLHACTKHGNYGIHAESLKDTTVNLLFVCSNLGSHDENGVNTPNYHGTCMPTLFHIPQPVSPPPSLKNKQM